MLKIGEISSNTALRRLKVIHKILNSTGGLPPVCIARKSYLSTKNDSNDKNDKQKKTYVRIGNTVTELKPTNAPEKIPRGYLSQYSGVLSDSQSYLKLLKWLMQKDQLKQDSFLIGSPPGAFRRNLAMALCELTQREAEYLCLTRDTTEADIKQRREIVSSSVLYANQCAVNAALNGRILIIEGIEKAERNLLPLLNNLLENRELNLDDGHFLVASERYDKLEILAKKTEELKNLNLLRVHEDFRVIAIGLPIPKYKGNPLDPPLRSRFQAHLVNNIEYDDFFKYLTNIYKNVDTAIIKKCCDFSYSFYTKEIESVNLPDFPIENLDKIFRIINNSYTDSNINLNYTKLIHKIYPYSIILKDEDKKFYFEMLSKFGLPIENSSQLNNKNEIDYEFLSVESKDSNNKTLKFKSSSQIFSIDLTSGRKKNFYENFIMNEYHSGQLVDMMLSHSSQSDFCLIGPQGSGKTELIKKFASLLDYRIETIYMYKDMNSRDLLQQRITLTNGDTKWVNSALVNSCLNGDLIVLDGIHRLRDDMILFLRRLIQDRELDLPDGSKLIRHDKYDEIKNQFKESELKSKILRIHPSFRLISTAEPPNIKASTKQDNSSINNQKNSDWLTSEIINLFLFHNIQPLDSEYEHEILKKKFKLNQNHEILFDLINQMRNKSNEDIQLKHISKFFSLRNLVRLSKKLEKHPELDIVELIENSSLQKFMPQLNRQSLNDFFEKNNMKKSKKENKNNLDFDFTKFKHDDFNSKTLKEVVKIPDIIFYENNLHKIILNNIRRDFELGEHLLLIGNQGTGKNKLADKFLMLTQKPREYIQLHRDTTINSLTIQPIINNGCVTYEDSPLVKAVKNGYVLVVDEADKAPLNVIGILKSLIESSEMILSDGRKIVPDSVIQEKNESLIPMHKNFRMIILANRPGFPFLGNDFFSILGDLLSCHPIDNPDMQSELEMLKMYSPNVAEKILSKLVSAFSSLRQLSDQGLISYPYSSRELVNIAKHLEKFPDDSLASVIGNVSDFDHFSENNDLKSTFQEIMQKNGIPVGRTFFQINLAEQINLSKLMPLKDIVLKNLKFNSTGSVHSIMKLAWNKIGEINDTNVNYLNFDKHSARVDSFSEIRNNWKLRNNQQIINDMLVKKDDTDETDLIYISGIKPLSILQFNTKTSKAVELNLSEHFYSAWRTYYPQTKLFSTNNSQSILLFEKATNDIYKIDFTTKEIFKLERFLQEANSSAQHFIKSVKKSINKFFIDQNQTYEMLSLEGNNENDLQFMAYRCDSNQLSLIDLNKNVEFNIDLNFESDFKFRVNHLTQLAPNYILITGYNSKSLKNDNDILEPRDLNFFILNFSESEINLESAKNKFNLSLIDSNLFSRNDLLLNQVQLKNYNNTQDHKSIYLPTVHHHFIQIPILEDLKSFFCQRNTPLTNTDDQNKRNKKFFPNVKSIIDFKSKQILTQLVKSARPENSKLSILPSCLGYLELIDLEEKKIRYFEINKESNFENETLNAYNYLNITNESGFLIEISSLKSGNFYTLDFDGNLKEWETNKMKINRSLDEWKKMVMNKPTNELNIEIFKESPNTKLRDFNGPKHGKVDINNAPHVGGNQWAGGSGGFDTAGLGGVGGPYRLDSGNQVFQISDSLKQSVPEDIRKAAREMGEKAFRERLREIQMSEHEHNVYSKYLELVRKPIQQLRNILESLEAKKKERQWLKNQTQGDLDDSKLVEAITGEKNVFKRRGDDNNADNDLNMEKPKRLRLVVDVSGSMYRFNGVDNRLERELESVLMVMESFEGFENKIKYDIVGHSGDGFNIKFVDSDKTPKNEADRLKVLKNLIAHSQFCSSGDHTFEATLYAIDELVKEEADDHFVIVLSDANFDRYGLSPKRYSQIMTRNDKVNVYCIFIGALGDQAVRLKNNLPSGKTFVCMKAEEIPRILQLIFQSAMLN